MMTVLAFAVGFVAGGVVVFLVNRNNLKRIQKLEAELNEAWKKIKET